MEYILFSLFVKHAIADLLLQSFRSPGDKSPLISKTNLYHSGDHGILTAIVFLLWGFDLQTAILLGLLDFTIHYTIDCSKTRFVRYMKWGRNGRPFWRVQAFDQMAHYATYMLLVILCS